MIDQHLNGIEKRQLAACREDALVRRIVRAEVRCVTIDNGAANLRYARDGGVARVAFLASLDGGLLDVARGGEVRLAGAKIRKVDAGALQPQRFGRNGHGRGDLNAVNAVRGGFGRNRRWCQGCAHAVILPDRTPKPHQELRRSETPRAQPASVAADQVPRPEPVR